MMKTTTKCAAILTAGLYTLPSCLPINNIVIFFRPFKSLIRILTSLFNWVDGCMELPFCCHESVLQSLTFSFCFFVIWALLSIWLFPFSIQRNHSPTPVLAISQGNLLPWRCGPPYSFQLWRRQVADVGLPHYRDATMQHPNVLKSHSLV